MNRSSHRTRTGTIVTATWLIGIGVVFLVQQTLALDWGDAWPLFVILVGVASLVSELAWGWRGAATIWTLTWPLLLIALGVLFLLSTTGVLGIGLGDLAGRGWPLLLVILGAWFLIGAVWPGSAPQEQLRLPLDGAAAADVHIRFGAGELSVQAGTPGNLVDGEFRGGVTHRNRGTGAVDLESDSWAFGWFHRDQRWRVGLTTEVPLDLRLDFGAARAEIDLIEHRLRTLRIATGASQTRVRLPSSAGETRVSAEAGAAELVFEVPAGVAAQVRSRMALGSTSVDEARFPRQGDRWASPDYATAPNRVEIDVQGGVGSVRVTS